jgi:hypothetical protein
VVGPEVVQQPVDVDEPQVRQGAVLVVHPAPGRQPHLSEVEHVRRHADVGPGRGGHGLGRRGAGDLPDGRGGDGDARGLEQLTAAE